MVVFKAPYGNAVKKAPTGFSWTTLFFGIWSAVFRGDMRNATFIFVSSIFTLGLAILVWAFIYNNIYISKLRSEG